MGITIANPALPTVRFEHAPLVFSRAAWGDDWQFQPELVCSDLQVCSASHGMSHCTIGRRYGYKKEPWESVVTQRPPWTGGAGMWVMVAFCGDNGYEPVFHGQIVAESRAPDGNDTGPMGRQTWSCRGPLEQLRKINISQSTWLVDGEIKTIGWIPPLNVEKENGIIRGNRSATEKLGAYHTSYHYGGDESWTYLQYLSYILAQFVNGDPSDDDTPTWSIGGQYALLHSIKEPITFGQTQTAAEVIAKLIPRSKGLDYGVVTTDEGFEIRVFSLNSKSATFGSTQLPSNPNTIDFDAGSGLDYTLQVAESNEEQYGKIRILGKPLVVCCSLNASKTAVAQLTGVATLQAAWSSTEEDEYGNCTEIDVPDSDVTAALAVCKKYRQQDRFRTVYRVYTAAATFMDLGIAQPTIVPTITADGEIDSDTAADHQYKIRATLDWVPLYENIDYGEIEANDTTRTMYADDDGETTPELLPPMAWIGPASNDLPTGSETMKYTPVEKIGANVAALKHHFGLWVETSPNHLLASSVPGNADTAGVYDYRTMIVTAAFETDQRLQLEHEISGGDASLVKEIYIDAEAWWMPSNTCVGLDRDNQPIRTSFERELRNDRDKMLTAMAGAIARYGNPRSRATITFNGIALWGGLIGRILETVYTGGVPHKISAPITSVSWSLPDVDAGDGGATTTVNTGYAQ